MLFIILHKVLVTSISVNETLVRSALTWFCLLLELWNVVLTFESVNVTIKMNTVQLTTVSFVCFSIQLEDTSVTLNLGSNLDQK